MLVPPSQFPVPVGQDNKHPRFGHYSRYLYGVQQYRVIHDIPIPSNRRPQTMVFPHDIQTRRLLEFHTQSLLTVGGMSSQKLTTRSSTPLHPRRQLRSRILSQNKAIYTLPEQQSKSLTHFIVAFAFPKACSFSTRSLPRGSSVSFPIHEFPFI